MPYQYKLIYRLNSILHNNEKWNKEDISFEECPSGLCCHSAHLCESSKKKMTIEPLKGQTDAT